MCIVPAYSSRPASVYAFRTILQMERYFGYIAPPLLSLILDMLQLDRIHVDRSLVEKLKQKFPSSSESGRGSRPLIRVASVASSLIVGIIEGYGLFAVTPKAGER